MDVNIFDQMVRYHIERNLAACLPYHDGEGAIRPAANNGRPVGQGKENYQYPGQLVFRNGNTLLGHLVADGFVKELDIDRNHALRVASPQDMYDFLGENHGDGVQVYESAIDTMVRVANIKAPDASFSERLPPHFVYSGRDQPRPDLEQELRLTIGTKTRLALALTAQYPDIKAMQIKQSGYTPLGMGQVLEYDHGGLHRAFFFKHIPKEADPNSYTPFLDAEHRIAGVMREYQPKDRGVVLIRERLVHPEEFFLDGTEGNQPRASEGRERRLAA